MSRGADNVWFSPHSKCQRFRIGQSRLTRPRSSDFDESSQFDGSSQYHQDVNPSLLLATQKATKIAFNRSLLSKSEDLGLVNKFNIFYTMAKERISLASFPNMRSDASLLAE